MCLAEGTQWLEMNKDIGEKATTHGKWTAFHVVVHNTQRGSSESLQKSAINTRETQNTTCCLYGVQITQQYRTNIYNIQ